MNNTHWHYITHSHRIHMALCTCHLLCIHDTYTACTAFLCTCISLIFNYHYIHNSLYVAYHFMSTCIVTMYTAFCWRYWLLHTVQFTFVAACCPVCYLLPHATQLLFVGTCRAVCYLLPHAIQLLLVAYSAVCFCCHMLHSLLFVATCRTVAIGSAYRAVYFCCCTPYSSIFVAACHAVCYSLSHVPYGLLFIAVICCRMLYSCYFLLHAIQLLFVATIYCRMPYSCYLLPHAVQLLFVATEVGASICCH